jgi:hypothetical protein
MLLRTWCLLFLLIAPVLPSIAQLETSHWFLRNNHVTIKPSGVNNVTPSGISSSFNPIYGSTSVSDKAGDLLFACDGNTIVDKNYSVMPALKGINFYGNNNKVLAVKIPNSTRYYVFYGRSFGTGRNLPWTLKYAIVDLSLNGGLGDVTSYDNVIAADLSQGFTLANASNNEDVWLITHRAATDNFLLYKITASGLQSMPVISEAGTVATTQDYLFRDLKTSHDGKMIAGIAYRDYTTIFAETIRFLEVFNLDATNGRLTSKVRTKRVGGYFDIFQTLEFSADNRLLYKGTIQRVDGLQPCGWGYGDVTQYNLCYTDSLEFTLYAMLVARDYQRCNPWLTWGRIQMGADKRIHMPFTGTTVSAIGYPNRLGSSSRAVFNAYQLPANNFYAIATPTFYHRELEKPIKNNIVYDGGCYPNPIRFRITNDTITSISWNFGDPASGGSNTSGDVTTQHVFSKPGIYNVSAQLFNNAGVYIETVTELIEIKDPAKRILDAYPADTTFCYGNSLKIKLGVVNGIYHWTRKSSNNSIYSDGINDSMDISTSDTYYVEMRQNDCNGCIMKDSIKVQVLPVPYVGLGNDRTLCTGDSVQLGFFEQSVSYTWSTGEDTSLIWIKHGGTYWVRGEINNNGCGKYDTIIIHQVPAISFNLPNDTTLCSNQQLLLSPGVTPGFYKWQDGSSAANFRVTKAGTYWVNVTNANGCKKSDTIHVNYIDAHHVSLGNDTSLCVGDSLTFSPGIPNATYAWSTGSASGSITIKTSGRYWVKVQNGICSVADTINVQFNPPPVFSLGTDTILCERDKLVLRPGLANASFLWQDGTKLDSLVVIKPGGYWLQVKKQGCTVSDSITVGYKPVPILSLGPDTVICAGAPILINAADPSIKSYKWQTLQTSATLVVQQAGTYAVQVSGWNGCINSDTVEVGARPLPVFTLGNDTTLCQDDKINYRLNLADARYNWSDGSQLPSYTITQPGVYWLDVFVNGCSKRDSITVLYKTRPAVKLGNDTIICEGSSSMLNAFYPGASYKWSSGPTASSLKVNQPGKYSVAVDFNGCIGRDTINIKYTYLPRFTLGADTMLCEGQAIILDAGTNNGHFLWQDGSARQTFNVTTPGRYRLLVTNDIGRDHCHQRPV